MLRQHTHIVLIALVRVKYYSSTFHEPASPHKPQRHIDNGHSRCPAMKVLLRRITCDIRESPFTVW